MGMFSSTRIEYINVYGENPDPSKFEILKCLVIGKFFVSEIRYPNCTNFEGRKVLLTTFDPRKRKELDPHFRENSGIIARFEPSAVGWIMAKQFAELSK